MVVENIKPLVSIVVPIYNVEVFLEDCVQSLLQQTYTNLEIILVDDGSPDECGRICDELKLQDPRIIVIHKENGGLSDARNAGLDMCTGAYIAFVDSDDVVHRQYVEKLLYNIGDADFIYCDYKTFYEEKEIAIYENLPDKELIFLSQKEAFSKLTDFADALIVVSWNKLYKREMWADVRFKVGVLHEDEHVIHHLLSKTQKIAYIDNILVYYRQREESITSNKKDVRSFLDKQSGYYDRYCFFKDQNMTEQADILLSFLLYRCAMRTVEKDNVVWQHVNSFQNIVCTQGLSVSLKMILLLKKYMYPVYSLLNRSRKK